MAASYISSVLHIPDRNHQAADALHEFIISPQFVQAVIHHALVGTDREVFATSKFYQSILAESVPMSYRHVKQLFFLPLSIQELACFDEVIVFKKV